MMNPSYSAVYVSLNGMRWEYFVSRSIITRIVSYSSLVNGSFNFSNLIMKSIVTSFYSKSGGS